MNEPIASSQTEFDLISDEIEKLFVFQDKHLSKEKKAILVEEIQKSNLPVGAVIQGVRALVSEELSSVKLSTIMASIRKFIEPEERLRGCANCLDGIITMRDAKFYQFSLGCLCARGQERAEALGLERWNGDSLQDRRGRTLERLEGVIS